MFVLNCFTAEMFSVLSAVFSFGWAFVYLCLFGCSLFGRLLGSLIKRTLTATANEYIPCYVLFFLCGCLQKVTEQREITTFCIFERT